MYVSFVAALLLAASVVAPALSVPLEYVNPYPLMDLWLKVVFDFQCRSTGTPEPPALTARYRSSRGMNWRTIMFLIMIPGFQNKDSIPHVMYYVLKWAAALNQSVAVVQCIHCNSPFHGEISELSSTFQYLHHGNGAKWARTMALL